MCQIQGANESTNSCIEEAQYSLCVFEFSDLSHWANAVACMPQMVRYQGVSGEYQKTASNEDELLAPGSRR